MMPDQSPLTALVLCGGAGTRLWPLSRKMRPKQFLPLFADGCDGARSSLFDRTVERVERLGIRRVIVVCHEDYRFFAASGLMNKPNLECTIVTEPTQKNTAPAAAAGALAALERYGDEAPLLLMPSDHLIEDASALQAAVEKALAAARRGMLVVFGVDPTREEAGFGYITAGPPLPQHNGGVLSVAAFREKPELQTVRRLLADGKCYWNSGIFMFRARSYLEAVARTCPAVESAAARAYERRVQDLDFIRMDPREFEKCPKISIDYAVMEHAPNLALVPTRMQWRDLGSWDSLSAILEKDESGNRTRGNTALLSSKNNVVFSGDRLVGLLGVENCIVADSEDAVLVAHRDCAQDIKSLVDMLAEQKRSEVVEHRKVYRPWGSYETMLDADGFKIKILVINPRQSLSLQSHQHRSEHWVVVKGEAVVTRGDRVFTLRPNQSTYIPAQCRHRLENQTDDPVQVVEVQCGGYLGEDDITRYEDRYGRPQRRDS